MVINFFTTLFFAHARVFIVMIAVISICILDNIIISFMKYRDQKKFMKDLVIERQRYEMIIEQLDELIVDCNATTKQIITSSQFKKTFGTAHTYLDVTDENPSIYINDKNILDNIKNTSDELFIEKIRLRNRNGHYSWYSIKLKYLYQNKKLVRVIGKIIDIDDSINKYNALKFESEHDLLTQLYNKTAFIKHSENYIAEHIASHSVLFFIDLDNFKSINDNLGHLYGDKVLKETASKLCSIFDYTDIISRFGGDEFCIFSPDVSSLEDKINAINSELKTSYRSDNISVIVSASIGIAIYPRDGKNIESLINKSDIALYNSKRHGKNQYTLYDESLASDSVSI